MLREVSFTSEQRLRVRHASILIGLFVVALLPRLSGIDRYVTPDELAWVYRSIQFREALLDGRWEQTLVSEHPGVITTWMGSLGISGQLLINPPDRADYDWITHVAWFTPDNMALFSKLARFLTAARLMTAVVNSLGLLLIYKLVGRLFGNSVGLLTAVLLALDPFLAGLSGLLHVDGLMTTFATIAILSLLVAADDGVKELASWRCYGWSMVSGTAAAWALLAKLPALLILPMAGLQFLLLLMNDWRNGAKRRRSLFMQYSWLASFTAAALITLPALGAGPGQVVNFIRENASRHIETVLRPTFFWGQTIHDPGPAYYPIALAFRLSPVVFIGLGLALVSPFVVNKLQRNQGQLPARMLLGWAILFLVGISLAVKKFDRYALAIIPGLTILAALAWMRLVERKAAWERGLGLGLLTVQAVYLLAFWPYPLAAYNPLVGGPWVAQKLLPIGWGEAIGAAGQVLVEQPGVQKKTAIAGIAPSLAPFFPGQTLLSSPENRGQADYIIQTAAGRQLEGGGWPSVVADLILLQTIHYGGLDQAWIFTQPNANKREISSIPLADPVSFDNRLQLLATKADLSLAGKLSYYVRWRLIPDGANGRYNLKLKLRDEMSNVWAEREFELVNDVYFYPEHWAAGEMPEVRYSIELPPGMPPARYTLDLTIFDNFSGAQLPVLSDTGTFQGVVYSQPNILVPTVVLGDVKMPKEFNVNLFDDKLTLLGVSDLPDTMTAGDTAVIDIYWRADKSLQSGIAVAMYLESGESLLFPISRYDSGEWAPGEQVREKYRLTTAPDLAVGMYSLKLQLMDRNGKALMDTAVTLGQIEIIPVDRLLTLPEGMEISLDYHFDSYVHLRGLDWRTPIRKPGEDVSLTLYWQTDNRSDDLLSAFVHLVGPNGDNVAQADRWPGGLPSHTWGAAQVIVDEYTISLPADASPGSYQVAVGLYTAADGLRLESTDGLGTAMPDDRVILPITLIIEGDHE